MTSYLCLMCGEFATGDEARRLLNLCPHCEQHQNPLASEGLQWQVTFVNPNKCLQCEWNK